MNIRADRSISGNKHREKSVKDHPYCGMNIKETKPVLSIVRKLRKSKYDLR